MRFKQCADTLERIFASEHLRGISRVDLETSAIHAKVQGLIPDSLKIQSEFHLTIGPGRTEVLAQNPNIETGQKVTVHISKLYINDQYAVLDVTFIDPPIKVLSGVPHITIASATGAKPANSKNAISQYDKGYDMEMSLSGVLYLPPPKEQKPAPKEKNPFDEKKKEINRKLFQSTLEMSVKKELASAVQKANSIEEIKEILGQKLSEEQIDAIL